MTKDEAIKALRSAGEIGDVEIAHSHADTILCMFLISLGYADVVGEYESIEKWYA